jgi:hypothetical protein
MTAAIKLPPLPDKLFHTSGSIWVAIDRWSFAEPGESAGRHADDVDDEITAALTAYATRAVLADRERTEGVMRRSVAVIEQLIACHDPAAPECAAIEVARETIAALREHLKEPR